MRLFDKNPIGYAKETIKKDEILFQINILTGEIFINPKFQLFPGAEKTLRKQFTFSGICGGK